MTHLIHNFKKYAWYKAAILLEAAAFACCAILPRAAMAQLVSSTIVSAVFTALSFVTRPYIEDVEDRTDIAGRIFMLVTLGVGIGLETEPGGSGRLTCNVILGIVAIAATLMFLVVLNPIKLLFGIRRAMRDAQGAARAAG